MTENMEMMFDDVMAALFNCFDEEHIEYLFKPPTGVPVLAYGYYVLLEFVKYSYFASLPKYPLRYFIPYNATDNDHSERMRYARALDYTQGYKDINYNLLAENCNWDKEKMKSFEALLGKNMSSIDARISGYELSEMDFFEHTTVQELRIIKSYVENRLCSAKKVSNQTFIDYFDEYDAWVQMLIERSQKSDEDMVFASMAFFTLEWKYAFEYVYLVACKMEQDNIDEVDFYTTVAMWGPLDFESRLGINIHMDSRMIWERQQLIDDFIVNGVPDTMIRYRRQKYIEQVGLMALFNQLTSIDGGLYKDWFKNNTCMKDWASFLRDYNVFDAWHKKEWTNKRINKARKIFEMRPSFPEK